MITLNQTQGEDNKLIWLVTIHLDSTTYRFAYWPTDVVLSGLVYKGGVLIKNSLNPTGREISLTGNKCIGTVGSLSFELSASGMSFKTMQPSTNQPYAIARNVDLSFVYEGATLDSQVTLFESYYIDDIKADKYTTSFSCIEKSELDLIEMPFYKVQKDFDNGISYYPLAPSSSYGQVIPIIYGFFSNLHPEVEYMPLAPSVCVNERKLEFKVSSHKVYSTSGQGIEVGTTLINSAIRASNGLAVEKTGYQRSETIFLNGLTSFLYTGSLIDTDHGIAGYNENKQFVANIFNTPGDYTRREIQVPSTVKYIAACSSMYHVFAIESEIGAVDSFLNVADAFKYQSEAGTYVYLKSKGVLKNNSYAGHSIVLLNKAATIRGTMYLQMKKAGEQSNTTEINAPAIDSLDNYTTLPGATNQNTLSYLLDTSLSSSNMGYLSTNTMNVSFMCKWESNNGGYRRIAMDLYRNNFEANGHDATGGSTRNVDVTLISGNGPDKECELGFADYTGWNTSRETKSSMDLPWTIDEVQQIDFRVRNLSGTGNDIKVYNSCLILRNFQVVNISPKGMRLAAYATLRGIKFALGGMR